MNGVCLFQVTCALCVYVCVYVCVCILCVCVCMRVPSVRFSDILIFVAVTGLMICPVHQLGTSDSGHAMGMDHDLSHAIRVFCFEDFVSDVCQGTGTHYSLFLSFILSLPLRFSIPAISSAFISFLRVHFFTLRIL